MGRRNFGKCTTRGARVGPANTRSNISRSQVLRDAGRFVVHQLEARLLLAADVVMSEIMFHPSSEDVGQEYVELYNRGDAAAPLTGWHFDKGITYTFTGGTLNAGQYLVVAADLAKFQAKYPGVTNVVGGWSGQLSNSQEQIRLVNAANATQDSVTYADEGDWAVRRKGEDPIKSVTSITRSGTTATVTIANHGYVTGDVIRISGATQAAYNGNFTITVPVGSTNTFTYTVSGSPATPATGTITAQRTDHGHLGWVWQQTADGGGASLELINTALTNDQGQNWKSSTTTQGTPGVANSVASTNIAPLITNVTQTPIVPRSTDTVTITAKLTDESTSGITASVKYRLDAASPGVFSTLAMHDDGLNGDVTAADGIWSVVLPVQANGKIVEFYISATDVGSHSRTLPAPTDTIGTQGANFLYQVDDTVYSGTQPINRLIMTDNERLELVDIGNGGAFGDQLSNAEMNGTYIVTDATGTNVRYTVGIRNRGHGSRLGPPNNYHVNFPSDNTLKGVTSTNFNSRDIDSQVIGAAIYQLSGLPGFDAKAVEVRVNGTDLATGVDGMFGSYGQVEQPDSDWADHHFGGDSAGNYYSAFRTEADIEADLRYEGTNPSTYQDRYFKETNASEDDWSDLIHLVDVLNNTPDQNYFQTVNQVINVNEWVHYLALDALLLNWETGLDRGIGDDYALYRGVNDPRFSLVPHDLDTLMNQGNATAPVNTSIFNFANVDGLAKFLNNPQILPLFYQAFLDQINTFYNPQTLNPLIDSLLGSFVPAANIASMKQFVVDRTAAVLAQIPRTYTINNTLPLLNGYPRSATSRVTLTGTADVTKARSILVNGLPAVWDARAGTWSVGSGGGTQTLIQAGVQGTQGGPPGAAGDAWKYLANGSNQGTAWRASSFNDSTWPSGASQLGYGDGDENTIVPSGSPKFITTYFRRAFTVTDKSQIAGLTLNVLVDDGAYVYLNGSPIKKINMPDTYDYSTPASNNVSGTDETTFQTFSIDPSLFGPLLVNGTNEIAVEVHQSSNTSTDVSFDLGLIAALPSAGAGIPLSPGINHITMRAYDGPNGTGNEVGTAGTDIYYDGTGSAAPVPANVSNLNLIIPDTYRPGTPLLIEARALDTLGAVQRELWDGTVTLSTGRSDLTLSPSTITLRNGVGSTLVTVGGAAAGTAPLSVTATLGTHQTTTTLASRAGVAMTNVSGTLSGANVSWSGIVHITSTVTVPVGTTLTIQPGTLVLVDGNPTPLSTNAAGIVVNGTLNSNGTAAQPVVITATDPAAPWGEINHNSSQPSQYHYTMITRAGHSPRGGHTNTGPAVRSTSSTITFDHCSISDLVGKTMQVDLSNITFTDSHIARSVMGPEMDRSALLFQNSWSTEMLGVYREDGQSDDDDSIYVHRQQNGQLIRFINSVFAGADDDGIDTLSPDVTVDGCIMRDIFDKGISVIEGTNVIKNTLMSNVDIGISAKAQASNPTSNNTVDHVTISANSIAIQSENKFGVPNAVVNINIRNSILRGTEGVRTDYASSQIVINYSDYSGSSTWTPTAASTNLITSDPMFTNKPAGDLHPRAGSPVINAGDPGTTNDPDGSRADMGYYLNGIPGTPAAQTIGTSTLPAGTTIMDGGGSPYHITGIVTVPVGAVLRIMPGTTLFFDPGAGINILGQLLAEGTDSAHIRFTIYPGSVATDRWNGLQYTNTMQDNRLTYCDLEWGGAATGTNVNNGMVGLDGSNLIIDHCFFDHADHRRIRSRDTNLIVQNSTFADIFGPGVAPTTDNFSEQIWGGGIPAGGHWIVRNNTFGTTKGHNDIIDFDPGVRPNPIAQILDNTFLGGGDDAMDLEGDAWIEGNLIQNMIKDQYNTAAGNSNGGSLGAGHNYTMVRNVFYNCEHVAQVKDGSFLTFLNNTVISNRLAAIYFFRPDGTGTHGRGAYVDGDIFYNTATLFQDMEATTDLVVNRSIVNAADVSRGTGNLVGDPRLTKTTPTIDAHLRPGSIGIGTGPNGIDMGAMVPRGASLNGVPPAQTAATSATITVGGPGIVSYKYKLNNGAYSAETPIATPISLTNLANGSYTVSVLGKTDAGTWQDDPIAFPLNTGPAVSRTWTVNTAPPTLRINELIADNATAVNDSGQFPDIIELYNDGSGNADLSGMSITDDQTNPTKFIFPNGTLVGPGQYKVLYLDGRTIAGETHIGAFSLKAGGEGVYLYSAVGVLIDGVTFGLQVKDLSIGRLASGQWGLTRPTFGSANQAQQTGDATKLRINEWLTQPTGQFLNDFVEIYNPDTLPIAIGGFYFTDDPATEPTKSQVPALSFLPASSYTAFTADGITTNGADHLNFGLAAEQGLIGLLDQNQTLIDRVIYEPQRAGFSEGRTPDGGTTYQFFSSPTPGITNGGAPVSSLPLRITEIMYHPANPTAGNGFTDDDYEYIEVQNVGAQSINLANVELIDGISFTFPNIQLAAGAYGLVVANQAAFTARYGSGLPVIGQFGGDLADEGERIRLEDSANATILDFAYDDVWYPSTDGTGFSLIKIDPNGATSGWGVGTNWRASNRLFGSPGAAEPAADSTAPTVDINDVTPDPRTTQVDSITITFNEPVVNFDLADLSLRLGAGSNLIGSTQTLTTADNRVWTLGNLGDLTIATGSYTLTLTATGSGITDLSNNALVSGATDTWQKNSASGAVVTNRRLFYNNSKFDTLGGDDAAIATDKVALQPGGGKATFANYSSYVNGINGIMIDMTGLPAGNNLSLTDFEFRTGTTTNNVDPATQWTVLGAAPSLSVRRNVSAGTDRIVLTWTDAQAVKKGWLRVMLKSGINTGLAAADVFYFGNALGDTGVGNDANTAPVDTMDYYSVRDHFRTSANPAPIDFAWDINRDAVVDAQDLQLVRANATSAAALTALQMISPPAAVTAPKSTTTDTKTTSSSATSVLRTPISIFGTPVTRTSLSSSLPTTTTSAVTASTTNARRWTVSLVPVTSGN